MKFPVHGDDFLSVDVRVDHESVHRALDAIGWLFLCLQGKLKNVMDFTGKRTCYLCYEYVSSCCKSFDSALDSAPV